MDSTKPATCERCGIERSTLHYHHIIPRSQGGSNDPANLIGLCLNCHEDEHGGPFGGPGVMGNTPEARKKASASWKSWYYDDPENKKRRADSVSASHARGERAHVADAISAWHRDNIEGNAARIERIKETKRARLAGDVPKRAGSEWQPGNERCLECRRTDRPHKAKGLCNACYLRAYRHGRA